MRPYSKAQLDAWRAYADSLAPGSYEQERVKLSIAMHECVNEIFVALEPIPTWLVRFVVWLVRILEGRG